MSDCTIVTSGNHGSIRTTFISNNRTQKRCNRKYVWLLFLLLPPSMVFYLRYWELFEEEINVKCHNISDQTILHPPFVKYWICHCSGSCMANNYMQTMSKCVSIAFKWAHLEDCHVSALIWLPNCVYSTGDSLCTHSWQVHHLINDLKSIIWRKWKTLSLWFMVPSSNCRY